MNEDLTREDAHELITYDPVSGRVWRKKLDNKWFKRDRDCNSWNARNAGKEITSVGVEGYIETTFIMKKVLLHRLIWLYMTGEWPDYVDHINGDVTDNRWTNLRDVSCRENLRNQKRRRNNTSGITGVYSHKPSGRWKASIQNREGKFTHLGYFDSFDEAVIARKAAEIKYGYHENHGRIVN